MVLVVPNGCHIPEILGLRDATLIYFREWAFDGWALKLVVPQFLKRVVCVTQPKQASGKENHTLRYIV